MTEPSPVVVNEGSVARFVCSVIANPPAIITWEVNQKVLPLETERYTAFHSVVRLLCVKYNIVNFLANFCWITRPCSVIVCITAICIINVILLLRL